MSNSGELRLWMGWRNAKYRKDEDGKSAFAKTLGQRFIPATWRIMGNFGLSAYVPTLLPMRQDAWPDEVALLAYPSVTSYEQHQRDPVGKAYSKMHGEVFTGRGDTHPSHACWAKPANGAAGGTDEPACRRDAKAGGATFNNATHVYVMALQAPATANAQGTGAALALAALSHLPGEMAAWHEGELFLIWLASGQPLTQLDIENSLRTTLPQPQTLAWHQAIVQGPLQDTGVCIAANSSLYFHHPSV